MLPQLLAEVAWRRQRPSDERRRARGSGFAHHEMDRPPDEVIGTSQPLETVGRPSSRPSKPEPEVHALSKLMSWKIDCLVSISAIRSNGGSLGQHLQAHEARTNRLQGGAGRHSHWIGCRRICEVQAGEARTYPHRPIAGSPGQWPRHRRGLSSAKLIGHAQGWRMTMAHIGEDKFEAARSAAGSRGNASRGRRQCATIGRAGGSSSN